MTQTATMKILIIKFRNIGDVLLTGPLASTLKSISAENHITALIKPGTEAMLQHHPHIDEVIISPKRKPEESKFQFLCREIAWLKQIKEKQFDLVINTTEGDHGALIGFFANIKHRLGAEKLNKDKWWRLAMLNETRKSIQGKRHTVVRNLDLLPDLDAKQYRHIHLGFTTHDHEHVEALLKRQGWRPDEPLIQIHPTSRWFFKCWNDQFMATIIDHLQSKHKLQVVLTSGPDKCEQDKIDNILSYCQSSPLNLAGRMSLNQTAALSSICKLFFGVDTAPMHMAAALNVPVIAIFGPSGAFDWGPWPNGWSGNDTPYPKQNGIQYCGLHTVIQKDWACVPCGQDGCEGSKRSRCLEETQTNEIIPIIDKRLAELGLISNNSGKTTST